LIASLTLSLLRDILGLLVRVGLGLIHSLPPGALALALGLIRNHFGLVLAGISRLLRHGRVGSSQ
jgi:hypothetical protein